MTWTNVGLYNSADSTTASTTLAIPRIGIEIPPGDVFILSVAADNVQTTTGESALVVGITDDSGNTWTKIGEYTYSAGTAGSGTTCSVWYAKLTNSMPAAGSITVNFASSITAKAAHIRGVTPTGSTISVADVQFSSTAAGDAPAMVISGLTSQQYYFQRSIASESALNLTAGTNYTYGGGDSANGSGGADSQTSVSEYRIVTGTGDTSDPTHGPCDQVGIYFALSDVAPVIPRSENDKHTALPPHGELSRRRDFRRAGWFDYTVTKGDSGAAPVVGEGGTMVRQIVLPPEGKRPLPVTSLTHVNMPAPADIDTQTLGSGVRMTALPPHGKPPLPKGFAGWMNRDNELACAAACTALPPAGLDRHSYDGFISFPVYAPNFTYPDARASFAVPLGRDAFDYSGFVSLPIQASAVQALQPGVMTVPVARDRHNYDGWQQITVGDDINELMGKLTDLPPVGPDRARWIANGFQQADVAGRDETGDLVAYRGDCEHSDLPPWARDRHSYAGFTSPPPVDDVEPPIAGFRVDLLPPLGRDRRDYDGWQQRTDLTDLAEDAVAGYQCTDLPPMGRFAGLPPALYQGHIYSAVPPDFVPEAGKIWRPIYRPRRR